MHKFETIRNACGAILENEKYKATIGDKEACKKLNLSTSWFRKLRVKHNILAKDRLIRIDKKTLEKKLKVTKINGILYATKYQSELEEELKLCRAYISFLMIKYGIKTKFELEKLKTMNDIKNLLYENNR